MNLRTLIEEECPNHLPDGSCMGADIDDLGRTNRCTPRTKCLVVCGRPCGYLEQLVLRMIENTHDKRKETELIKARENYEVMKHECERTTGRHIVERTPNANFAGLCEETASAPYPGRRSPGDPTGAGSLCLQGPGSLELDRITEDGLSLSRI